MKREEEYRLSQYQSMGFLDERKKVCLKRHNITGEIFVEKRVSAELQNIYQFLQENPCENIPKIEFCIRDGEELIVLEEYIIGRNVEEILQEKKLTELEAVRIALEICRALKVLHHATPMIICRDLKAENVMVTVDGRVKLVDFNIARTVQEGQIRDTQFLGTVEYAAPEQYGFSQTDNRTDIYALGVFLNYMILKKFPVEQMVTGPIREVVLKCTLLEPGARYQTVEEVEERLQNLYPQFGLAQSEQDTEENSSKGKRSWRPPGFRTGRPWKMILAVIGYVGLTWYIFTMDVISSKGEIFTGIMERIAQTVYWLGHLVYLGILFDYGGCSKKIPLLHNKYALVRGIAIVLWYLVVLTISFLIVCIFEDCLWY